jgi:hypothetical protein
LEYGLPHNSNLKPSNLIIQNTHNNNLAAQPINEQEETTEEIFIEEKTIVEEIIVNDSPKNNESTNTQKEKKASDEASFAQEGESEDIHDNQEMSGERKGTEVIDFCDLSLEISALKDQKPAKITRLKNSEINPNPSLKFLSGIQLNEQKTIECYDNPKDFPVKEVFIVDNEQDSLQKHESGTEVNIPQIILQDLHFVNLTEEGERIYIAKHNRKVLVFSFNPSDLPQNVLIIK